MKNIKQTIRLAVLPFIIIFAMFLVGKTPTVVVAAPSTTTNTAQQTLFALPEDLGNEVAQGSTGIVDGNLYNSLISIYNATYASEPEFVALTSVYENMLQEFTSLNLQNKMIYNLSGFQILNMPLLTELDLSKNRISSISQELSAFTALETLNLFDNELTSLNLSYLTNLQNLNANKNQLSNINLSAMQEGLALLNFNRFTSFNNITLPSAITNLSIQLINNSITNAQEYLQTPNLHLQLGLQGLGIIYKENVSVTDRTENWAYTNSQIKYYNITDYDAKLQIYNYTTNELVGEYQNSAEGVQVIELPIGTYYSVYTDSQNDNLYVATDSVYSAFAGITMFTIKPSLPTVEFKVNNVLYEYYPYKISKDSQLIVTTYDADAVVYYKIGNSDWVQGAEIDLPMQGTYYVSVKTVVNNIESNSITITVKSPITSVMSEGLLLLLILMGSGTVMFGAYLLLKKYVFEKLK